jgi:NADH-quinone oxidoreductase subunit J
MARFRGESIKDAATLPAPGTFARHNAVDVPALGPDGQPNPASISKVLEARGDIISSAPFELKAVEEEEK